MLCVDTLDVLSSPAAEPLVCPPLAWMEEEKTPDMLDVLVDVYNAKASAGQGWHLLWLCYSVLHQWKAQIGPMTCPQSSKREGT